MRTHEIIAWALRAIEQAKAGQPYEDSHVEFKSVWIEPRDAARHIAGHANAARGEPILWLMGVTPTGEVPGVPAIELANWYPQVKSHFDDVAPELIDVNIPVDDVTVVALLWNTEPAPFVFKTGRGDTPREVLYRHGTRNDVATRSQLIRILSPLARQPQLEIISCSLDITRARQQGSHNTILVFKINARAFIHQAVEQQSVIARHRCEVSIVAGDQDYTLRRPMFRQLAPTFGTMSTTLTTTGASEFEIQGDSSITVPATVQVPPDQQLTVSISFKLMGFDLSARVQFTVHEMERRANSAHWEASHSMDAP